MAKALSVDAAHHNQNSGRVNITTSLPVYVFNLASVSVFYIIKTSGSTVKVELLLNPPFTLIPLPAVSGQLHFHLSRPHRLLLEAESQPLPPVGCIWGTSCFSCGRAQWEVKWFLPPWVTARGKSAMRSRNLPFQEELQLPVHTSQMYKYVSR